MPSQMDAKGSRAFRHWKRGHTWGSLCPLGVKGCKGLTWEKNRTPFPAQGRQGGCSNWRRPGRGRGPGSVSTRRPEATRTRQGVAPGGRAFRSHARASLALGARCCGHSPQGGRSPSQTYQPRERPLDGGLCLVPCSTRDRGGAARGRPWAGGLVRAGTRASPSFPLSRSNRGSFPVLWRQGQEQVPSRGHASRTRRGCLLQGEGEPALGASAVRTSWGPVLAKCCPLAGLPGVVPPGIWCSSLQNTQRAAAWPALPSCRSRGGAEAALTARPLLVSSSWSKALSEAIL